MYVKLQRWWQQCQPYLTKLCICGLLLLVIVYYACLCVCMYVCMYVCVEYRLSFIFCWESNFLTFTNIIRL
jgi:hypothetical protein